MAIETNWHVVVVNFKCNCDVLEMLVLWIFVHRKMNLTEKEKCPPFFR